MSKKSTETYKVSNAQKLKVEIANKIDKYIKTLEKEYGVLIETHCSSISTVNGSEYIYSSDTFKNNGDHVRIWKKSYTEGK